MNNPFQQAEFPITDAGVCQVEQFLSDDSDQRPCILALKDINDEDPITIGMNLAYIVRAIGSSSRQIHMIQLIETDAHSRCLCFLSSLLPVHLDLDQRPIGIHIVNTHQEQLWMAANPRFAKQVHRVTLDVPWQLKPEFWSLLKLQDFISQAVHLKELTVTHSRPLMDVEEKMLYRLRERGVNVDIRSDYSKMAEDGWDSFSWDRIRDENDGEDDAGDIGGVDEDFDEDVSEGKSSVQTSSDEEPTTEDCTFIVLDTYESSGEDVDSDDEIDEEDAHVGYIESDDTFVPLAGYEDLILKPSLKLHILQKHTVERPARPVKEAACSESRLLDMMCLLRRK